MSYHSELDAERRATEPSDDAIAAAEQRGARAALTRLAEDIRVEMHALQQRADAEGYVSEDVAVGLAETQRSPSRQSGPASQEKGLGKITKAEQGAAEEPSLVTVDAAPAPTPALNRLFDSSGWVVRQNVTFAPREWWVSVDPDGTPLHWYYSLESAQASSFRPIVHVREVRPLTAGEVEVLAQVMRDAWALTQKQRFENGLHWSSEIGYIAEARAALAHLGIPYKEA